MKRCCNLAHFENKTLECLIFPEDLFQKNVVPGIVSMFVPLWIDHKSERDV